MTERKASLIAVFPQLLKIIAKESWNFSHKCHSIRFEKQIRTVIGLGPPVSESSIRISKIYDPLIQNTNLIKRESKLSIHRFQTGVPLTLNLQSLLLHLVQLTAWGVLKFNIPIYKVLEQSWRKNLTSLKLCKCCQNPHPASREYHQTPAKTNHHCLNHLQTLRIH